jgi:hypothetical protein
VKLLGYDYRIEYKRGRENKAADGLSRAPSPLHAITVSSAMPKWITEVTTSYQTDEYCTDLIAKLTLDNAAAAHYTLKSGILRYKKENSGGQ